MSGLQKGVLTAGPYGFVARKTKIRSPASADRTTLEDHAARLRSSCGWRTCSAAAWSQANGGEDRKRRALGTKKLNRRLSLHFQVGIHIENVGQRRAFADLSQNGFHLNLSPANDRLSQHHRRVNGYPICIRHDDKSSRHCPFEHRNCTSSSAGLATHKRIGESTTSTTIPSGAATSISRRNGGIPPRGIMPVGINRCWKQTHCH